jgi:hypothetical protein
VTVRPNCVRCGRGFWDCRREENQAGREDCELVASLRARVETAERDLAAARERIGELEREAGHLRRAVSIASAQRDGSRDAAQMNLAERDDARREAEELRGDLEYVRDGLKAMTEQRNAVIEDHRADKAARERLEAFVREVREMWFAPEGSAFEALRERAPRGAREGLMIRDVEGRLLERIVEEGGTMTFVRGLWPVVSRLAKRGAVTYQPYAATITDVGRSCLEEWQRRRGPARGKNGGR